MEDLSWILEDMNEDDLLDLEDELKEKEGKMKREVDAQLPDHAFVTDPKNGDVVMLTKGKKGYSEIPEMFRKGDPMAMNESMNITEVQAKAMHHGSHVGFDHYSVEEILKEEKSNERDI